MTTDSCGDIFDYALTYLTTFYQIHESQTNNVFMVMAERDMAMVSILRTAWSRTLEVTRVSDEGNATSNVIQLK